MPRKERLIQFTIAKERQEPVACGSFPKIDATKDQLQTATKVVILLRGIVNEVMGLGAFNVMVGGC